MQPHRAQTIGVLLAGGQSRRMGGGDKGLAMLAGKPMMQHVIDRLVPQCRTLVINANGDPKRFAAFPYPVIADTITGNVGPLAGVLAGMRWAAANAPSAKWVVTVSTDAPFLPDDLVARLLGGIESNTEPAQIVLAESDGNLHPVIGLWPVALADDLDRHLQAGVRKVLAWTDRHGTAAVSFGPLMLGDRTVDPFFNVNTPEDMAAAAELLTSGRPNAVARNERQP